MGFRVNIRHASRLRGAKKWGQFALLPLSALVLSACAHAPDLPSVTAKQTSDYASAKSFDVNNKVSWPVDRWWLRYGDTQLNQFILSNFS